MNEEYEALMKTIKSLTKIDLSLYKEAQMKRRLASFCEKKNMDFFALCQALPSNKQLLEECLDRMTINVSSFFRNPERWDVFMKEVIPKLQQKKRLITIWSAACSTGEEAYTLSAIVHHFSLQATILATDLDTAVLEKARRGVYAEEAIHDIPLPFRNRYFAKTREGIVPTDALRKNVTFQQHNLLYDPFPRFFDIIVCRNVMIYFTEQAKEQLYQRFSESLHEGGYFFVGSTEQIFKPSHYRLSSFLPFLYEKEKRL
ncbi:chemotaxis protein methyltransferase [Fictibacillus macauensis ZFHKF-1]|uniref:Chemotaxis protein methyltransferase n=1 Tax=Fictibacillus macauensis ZFHKF-1 TaxID=1196324 RepID=I8AL49_9BACL|nr:protein-glutamate O-methyltransferase CheR [Fictibacillus macauensis]EIT86592.1 chemotaxis protein methyltransferase [Fictibacillus macauensis ZFHKF-1]